MHLNLTRMLLQTVSVLIVKMGDILNMWNPVVQTVLGLRLRESLDSVEHVQNIDPEKS